MNTANDYTQVIDNDNYVHCDVFSLDNNSIFFVTFYFLGFVSGERCSIRVFFYKNR